MLSRYCERCERITRDGHLWCQDKDCPAEHGYPLLDYGDLVGDLKVTKVVRVWRSAVLYEALRGNQPVLLKVAHAGPECEERLKREALLQQALNDRARPARSFLPAPRPLRLQLLPPYPTPSKRPYGEITVQGEPKIYCVYQHIAGRVLSDLLLESLGASLLMACDQVPAVGAARDAPMPAKASQNEEGRCKPRTIQRVVAGGDVRILSRLDLARTQTRDHVQHRPFAKANGSGGGKIEHRQRRLKRNQGQAWCQRQRFLRSG